MKKRERVKNNSTFWSLGDWEDGVNIVDSYGKFANTCLLLRGR